MIWTGSIGPPTGHATAEDLAAADWTLPDRMAAALGRARLDAAPDTRLAALSGGQRTRAALASLVFANPDFLLLDEPTNNLDRAGRAAVTDLLGTWRGGAVVISHDRALLDVLDATAELTPKGLTRYGGNWSFYRAQKDRELAAVAHDLSEAEKTVRQTAQAAQKRTERQARRDGAGRRQRAKADQPKILLNAMRERSETTAGTNARLADDRLRHAREAAAEARTRIEAIAPFSVDLPATGLPPGRMVLHVDQVTAGHTPGRPVLRDVSLTLTGPERVAVTGANGSGKTTLLNVIAGRHRPWSGDVRVPVPFVLLDQQVGILEPASSIRDNYRRLNPDTEENECRAALARFRFRADAPLQSAGSLSGGELLRAGLACTLGRTPLVILDEPTNHLDLWSIEAVEAGLSAFDGALLVVSHDETFLDAIGIQRRLVLPPLDTD